VGGSKKHGGPDLGPTRARQAWQKLHVNGNIVGNSPPEKGFRGYKNKEGFEDMPLLTVRMAARIQGFPDWWEFYGKKTPAYRQVGNAFPPPVAKAIGTRILNALCGRSIKHSAADFAI
jgi:DNA (cytosine-5)-methyltransferase 1